jgi:hypothetical protein
MTFDEALEQITEVTQQAKRGLITLAECEAQHSWILLQFNFALKGKLV